MRATTAANAQTQATELAVLRWLLPLALLHGMLYVFVMPPWQHYDEPGHFEYAWAIATSGLPPAAARSDPEDIRVIADSMYRHAFYPEGQRPDILSATPPRLGENQRVHPPLYYALAAVPMRLVRYLAIEDALYAARLLSTLLYAGTILAAWRIAVVVVPDEPQVQRIIPLLVLAAPAFADLMSAVNSDVLVNFSAATLLLGCVLVVRDGLRPFPLALALLSLLVAVFSKRTGLIGLVPFSLALFWSLRRQGLPWWAGPSALIGGAVLTLLLGFQWVTRDDGSTVLGARPWLAALDARYLRLQLDYTIQSLSDWQRSAATYPWLVPIVFDSFWVRFGWDHIGMGPFWTWAMRCLALASCVGLAIIGWQQRAVLPLWQQRCILLFLAVVAAGWLAVVLRVHPIGPDGRPSYIPRGRYMFSALIPTVWLLALGYQGLLPSGWRRFSLFALLAFFLLLALAALAWAIPGYYG
jgi:hypothetical protein